MQDQVADLEPQDDASASPDVENRFGKSINTAEPEEPVEAEAETEEPEGEQESEADSSTAVEEDDEEKTDAPEGKLSEGVQKRIDELTERFRSTERTVAEKDLEIAELRKQLESVEKPPEPFKTIEDFEYDNAKYQAYLGAEIERRATEAAERVAKGFEAKASTESRQESFRRREAEFAKTVKDYNQVVYGEVDGRRLWSASDAMAREIMLSDIGEQVAYHLASNPDIAADIARLPERETVRRMALLEDKLKAEKAKKPNKVSKTPPPPPKIKAGDAGLTKDVADMSDKEFAAWRRKQIAARS